MARKHLRRIVALAATAFLVSTSAGALAAEETTTGPAATTASSAGDGSGAPASASKSDVPKSTDSSKLSDSQSADSAPGSGSSGPANKSEPEAVTAPAADASATAATPDPVVATAKVTGDDAASAPVKVPAGLDDGRLFPDMTNTPDGTGVLVGGSFDPGRGENIGDTWIFRDGTWLPICGTTEPGANTPCALPARSGGALGTAPGGVIMFGGHPGGIFGPTGPSTGDTWKFDGTSWQQVCADATCGPPARSLAAIAGNAAMSLMFGGLTNNLGAALEDTWAFDGTTWTQLCGISMGVPCGPSARFWSSMSWDGTRFVLFGGMAGDFADGATAVADTWIWTGTTWQLVCDGVSTACGPAARAHAAFPTLNSPDPALAGSFLAGGLDLKFGGPGTNIGFRDLWFWSAQSLSWRQLTSPWGANVTWVGDGPPPPDGLPLAFGGAATNDCQVVFYGTVLGDRGTGVSNTSTLAGWDNGQGRPATCAEQAIGHGGTQARLARYELEGGLPLTGGSPLSDVLLGSILALVGLCLVLVGRRRTLHVGTQTGL